MIADAGKLDAELKAAGIPIDGCSSDGRIDFKKEATADQRDLASQILAAHDATPELALKEQFAAFTNQGQRIDFIAKFLNLK